MRLFHKAAKPATVRRIRIVKTAEAHEVEFDRLTATGWKHIVTDECYTKAEARKVAEGLKILGRP